MILAGFALKIHWPERDDRYRDRYRYRYRKNALSLDTGCSMLQNGTSSDS
jgi:hypothetical protein